MKKGTNNNAAQTLQHIRINGYKRPNVITKEILSPNPTEMHC